MGVDAIHVRCRNFKISKENLEKFLDVIDEGGEQSFDGTLEEIGWSAVVSRKTGVSEVRRECEGWINLEEFGLFQKMAPFVDDGAEIEFEIIYGGASYELWKFENGKLNFYNGEQKINWVLDPKPERNFR